MVQLLVHLTILPIYNRSLLKINQTSSLIVTSLTTLPHHYLLVCPASSPLIPSTNPKSSEMSSQTLIFLMVLFFVQLASSPIQALPSHQAPSSGTSYSDLNDKSPSREMHGRLREQTSHEGDGTCRSFQNLVFFFFPSAHNMALLVAPFKTILLD